MRVATILRGFAGRSGSARDGAGFGRVRCAGPVSVDASGSVAATTSRRSALRPVELPIPIVESCHPFLPRNRRSITHCLAQRRAVCTWFLHVSRLHRQHVLDRLLARAFFDHFDVAKQFDGSLTADVVDPPGRIASRGGSSPCPRCRRGRRSVRQTPREEDGRGCPRPPAAFPDGASSRERSRRTASECPGRWGARWS